MLAVARAHTLGKLPAAFAGYILEFAHSQRAFGLALGDPWRRRAGDLARALGPAARSLAFHKKPVRGIPRGSIRRSRDEPDLRRTRCPAAAMARGGRLPSRRFDRLWNDARSLSLTLRVRLNERCKIKCDEVRFGSLADIAAALPNVRFASESGHASDVEQGPLGANSDMRPHASWRACERRGWLSDPR